jgi:hypothetical protein
MMIFGAVVLTGDGPSIVGATGALLVSGLVVRHALHINPPSAEKSGRHRKGRHLERLGLGGTFGVLVAFGSIWTILVHVLSWAS